VQLNLLDDGSASAEKHETRTRLSLSTSSNRLLSVAARCGSTLQRLVTRSRLVTSIAVRGTQVSPSAAPIMECALHAAVARS
jgi:hypothetical protein